MTTRIAASMVGMLAILGPEAHANISVLPDESASNALQCLQRRAAAPKYPAEELRRRTNSTGYLRVKLGFAAPDLAPKVEILANTASEAMQDEALDYVRSYRLPCMKPEHGQIEAVQEFLFDALGTPEGKPLRLADSVEAPKACVVMPRRAPEPPYRTLDREPVQVLVQVRFDGGATRPPTTEIVHTDASKAVQHMVLDYLAEYRMPCRQEGDKPYAFEQQFMFVPFGSTTYSFREPKLALDRFLASMKGIAKERVFFDFNSMSCPFQVDWKNMQPIRPNRVAQLGHRNDNRAEFTAWLAGLEMNLPERQARSLIGSRLVVDVPCGVLDLRTEPPGAS